MRDKYQKSTKEKEAKKIDRVRDIDHNGHHEDEVVCAEDIIKKFPFMSNPDFLMWQ